METGRCGWIEHISHYLAPRGGRGIGASLHTVFLLAQSGAHRPLIEASFDTAAVRCPSQTEPHPLVRRKEIMFSIKRNGKANQVFLNLQRVKLIQSVPYSVATDTYS